MDIKNLEKIVNKISKFKFVNKLYKGQKISFKVDRKNPVKILEFSVQTSKTKKIRFSRNTEIDNFEYNGVRITNLEMETSAIYGLSKLLGHNACSMNAIIANRANGTFSEDPYKPVDELIAYTLNKLSE